MTNLLAFLALLAALFVRPFPALAADPFPDQPGVLTADELRAATVAMQSARGAETKLPLTASGRRAGGVMAYAVFSALPEGEPGASLRRRLFCHAAEGPPRPGEWTCDRETLHEIRLPGIAPQVFAVEVTSQREDPQLPGRLVGYFARCFGGQYRELTGQPYAGGVPAISRVTTDLPRVHVSVGVGDTFDGHYSLHAAAPEPGLACDLQLLTGRTRTSQFDGATRKQNEDRRYREGMDKVTDASISLNIIAGLLALVVPFFALLKGRKSAAIASAVLTTATVVFAAATLISLELARMPGAGHSLLVVIPLTVLVLMSCGIWVAVAVIGDLLRGKPKQP